jgi:hypothetical protein
MNPNEYIPHTFNLFRWRGKPFVNSSNIGSNNNNCASSYTKSNDDDDDDDNDNNINLDNSLK